MWKNCQQKLPICCEIENLMIVDDYVFEIKKSTIFFIKIWKTAEWTKYKNWTMFWSMLKKFWSVEFGVVLIESEEDDSSGLRANAQKFSSCQMRKKIFNQEISIFKMFKKGRMFWSMLSVADL